MRFVFFKKNQNGFTFIELILTLVILSTLATMSTYFVVDIAQLYIQKKDKNELLEEARHVMRMITKEVRSASAISDPPLPLSPGTLPVAISRIQFNQVYPGADLTNVVYAHNAAAYKITRVSDTQISVPVATNVTAFAISRDSYNVISISVTFSNGGGRPLTLSTFVRPRAFSIL